MKLLYQTHSPFARKALVFAHEAGLADRLEVIHHETSPTLRNDAVFALNPLGKVPVLITPNDLGEGEAIFDSGVICQHLDTLHDGPPLIPTADRIAALRWQAVADGISEAGVLARWETTRRPEALRYPPFGEGQLAKVAEGCAYLEARFRPAETPGLAEIAIATTLSWIVFRAIHDLAAYPRLAAWLTVFERRASMRATTLAGETLDA